MEERSFFYFNGELVERKAGQPLPAGLMERWILVLLEHPYFLEKMYVWGHPRAYQCEVNSVQHAHLIREEVGAVPVVHQVDMFAGELTEKVEQINYNALSS